MVQVDLFSVGNDRAEPMILVHGGAWDIPDDECEAHRKGLLQALEKGAKSLENGSLALDVAVAVVAEMEVHGAFDAGRGAVLNQAGEVELDAGVMDGATQHFGAVAGIQHFVNPVRIAREIIGKGRRQICFLVGEGAENFALECGFTPVEHTTLICERERRRYASLREKADFHTSHPFLPAANHPRGTVGCVVRDHQGNLAAATSTGGTPFRMPGRVGDSPMPGSGYFANIWGAASATGWGEAIASISLCYEAVRQLEGGSAETAAANVIQRLSDTIRNEEGVGATGGIILLAKDGGGAFAYSTPRMARGAWQAGKVWVEV